MTHKQLKKIITEIVEEGLFNKKPSVKSVIKELNKSWSDDTIKKIINYTSKMALDLLGTNNNERMIFVKDRVYSDRANNIKKHAVTASPEELLIRAVLDKPFIHTVPGKNHPDTKKNFNVGLNLVVSTLVKQNKVSLDFQEISKYIDKKIKSYIDETK